MYKNILVPLDGSPTAEAVLPYAGWLAGALKLPISLLHVSDPETRSPALHPNAAADYLKQTAAAHLSHATVRCVMESGAAEVRFDTVILPLDGSHLAEQTFPHVVFLASQLGLSVVVLRTYELPSASYFLAAHLAAPEKDELRAKLKGETEDYLRSKVAELAAQGIKQIRSIAAEGSSPEKIIELAGQSTGSLVVMSSHGRSGMGRWILGSVTDRVVSHGGEPVLVIRPGQAVK